MRQVEGVEPEPDIIIAVGNQVTVELANPLECLAVEDKLRQIFKIVGNQAKIGRFQYIALLSSRLSTG